jgi:hypothetical protein
MKNLIITAALIAAASLHAVAQEKDDDPHPAPKEPTEVEKNFNIPERYINIRDYVYLKDKAKMIIELNHVQQYEELQHIDTLLRAFMREIAVYKDSLDAGSGSVRIDYAQDDELSIRKIRIKKHPADGDIYMSGRGERARLKLDQDTVRIFVRHNPAIPDMAHLHGWRGRTQYELNNAQMYQVTFCVNSYEDLAKMATDKTAMLHAIDTLQATKREGTKINPRRAPSSAKFNPYATQNDAKKKWMATADVRFKQYSGLIKSDTKHSWNIVSRGDNLSVDANVGMGLIRNTFAPQANIGLAFTRYFPRPYGSEYPQTIIRAYASAYFFFEKNAAGDYLTKDNWFVNADIGESNDLSMGVGYLFSAKGDYFKNTTMKAFLNVRVLKKGLTLSPELIFTDNFRQIFPALSVRVF